MLGGRHLSLHFKVPIAIDMRIDDRSGALGRQGPVINEYRHRVRIVAGHQVIRVCPDRCVYLCLRWRIGVTGLGTRDGLLARAIFRPTRTLPICRAISLRDAPPQVAVSNLWDIPLVETQAPPTI